jgi:hypothetical protein
MIKDVTLFHSTLVINYQLKEDSLADAEARKNRDYKADQHAHGLVFAPLACNSSARQGPNFLRYLWLVPA